MGVDTFISELVILPKTSIFYSIFMILATYFVFVLVIIVLTKYKDKKFIKNSAIAVLAAFIISQLIQLFVKRINPIQTTTTSFPSDHAAISFAITSLLVLNKKKYWVVALVVTIILIISRIIVGFHYFSDILVGSIIGFLAGFLINKGLKWRK